MSLPMLTVGSRACAEEDPTDAAVREEDVEEEGVFVVGVPGRSSDADGGFPSDEPWSEGVMDLRSLPGLPSEEAGAPLLPLLWKAEFRPEPRLLEVRFGRCAIERRKRYRI